MLEQFESDAVIVTLEWQGRPHNIRTVRTCVPFLPRQS